MNFRIVGLAVALATTGWTQSQVPAKDLELFYTGRLLGHARIPSRQSDADCACTPGMTKHGSKAARALLENLRQLGYTPHSGQLLLGLGDNFAPEIEARFVTGKENHQILPKDFMIYPDPDLPACKANPPIWVDTTDTGRWPEDSARRYALKVEGPGRGVVPFDNVACFLEQAGYNAFVPGKHDFFYGAERLRQLGQLLHDSGQVRMLGANLHVSTKRIKPRASIPEQFIPRRIIPPFLPGQDRYTTHARSFSISLPNVVYPWLREIATKNLPDHAELSICKSRDGDPETLDGAACAAIKPGERLILPENILQARRSFGICVKEPTWEYPECRTFTVAQPFVHFGEWDKGFTPQPFYVHENRVAVFGVVGSGLAQQVAGMNRAWQNLDLGLETRLEASAEVEALEQAMQACAYDAVCRAASRKILLAQMPEEHAGALARRFNKTGEEKNAGILAGFETKFDIVLSEANTRGATPAQTVVRLRSDQHGRNLVFSPGPVYRNEDSRHLDILAQKVTVTPGHRQGEEVVLIAHEIKSTPIGFPNPIRATGMKLQASGEKETRSLAQAAADALGRELPEAKEQVEFFQTAILEAMRREYQSDVAVLQARDVFRLRESLEDSQRGYSLREALERTLWKGDFLLSRPVKGSVLKALMDRSKELLGQDNATFHLDSEHDRSLIKLGISFDATSQQWFVNGSALDMDRLYAVAMSDYMAFGDTDYPQLREADGISAGAAQWPAELRPLSTAVCLFLSQGTPDCGRPMVETSKYVDYIRMGSPDQRTVRTGGEVLLGNLKDGLQAHDPLRGKDATEILDQGRRVFSVTLEQLNWSYNAYFHNRPNEKAVVNQFGGLTSPQQVFSPESNNLSLGTRLRAQQTHGPGDMFLLGEQYYMRARTRDKNSEYIPDVKQNMWAVEGGWNPRLGYRGARRPEWLGIASLRLENNIVDPLTAFSLGGVTVRGTLDKSPSFLGKVGVRWRGVSSWFEAGFQAGRRYGIPAGFVFAPSGLLTGETTADSALKIAGAFRCAAVNVGGRSADADPSLLPLSDCIKTQLGRLGDLRVDGSLKEDLSFAFRANYLSRPRVGNFLNFHLQVPIPGLKDWSYAMDNRGEFYFGWNGDVPQDTRVLDIWSNSLQIGILKNLSIVPKIEYFYFQNKVNLSSLTGRTLTIGLQYRFDWRPGLPWSTVLVYPYPPAPK